VNELAEYIIQILIDLNLSVPIQAGTINPKSEKDYHGAVNSNRSDLKDKS